MNSEGVHSSCLANRSARCLAAGHSFSLLFGAPFCECTLCLYSLHCAMPVGCSQIGGIMNSAAMNTPILECWNLYPLTGCLDEGLHNLGVM